MKLLRLFFLLAITSSFAIGCSSSAPPIVDDPETDNVDDIDMAEEEAAMNPDAGGPAGEASEEEAAEE